jgi:DNA-binding transcriptional LysR family regulator
MELLQLRYFLTVAELQNITKAAEALYITQPALSRSISRLESSVGFPLFDRIGMRIELNKSGQIFYDYTKKAMNLLDQGLYLAGDAYNQTESQICIGASVPGVLPMYIDEYVLQLHHSEGSKPRVKACVLTPQILEQQILNGLTAFGICMFPSENAKLDWIPLFEEELFIVIGRQSNLQHRPVEPLSTFAGEAFTCNIDWENRRIINEACSTAGFNPRIAVETNEILTYDAVQHIEYGIAVAPAHMCAEMLSYGSRTPDKICRIIDPPLRRSLGLVKRKDRVLEGDELEFFQSILKKSKLIEENFEQSARIVAKTIGAE